MADRPISAPGVIWLIQAQRQLRHSLANELCQPGQPADGTFPQPIVRKMSQLNEILQLTFPLAESIVVCDLMIGFRRKDQTHVLLVEVQQADQGGPFVVKIGPEHKLIKELDGWNCCRPVGLKHDLVLLPLEKGRVLTPESATDTQSPLMSLIYGDAQQFIGVDRTVSLEEAFLDAVCYGNPSIESIGFVLVEMLERLGHLLYSTSFVDDPQQPDFVLRLPTVPLGVKRWKSQPLLQSIRSDTNVLVNHAVSRFIDPVDYFEQWVLPYFNHEEKQRDGSTTVHSRTATFSAGPLNSDDPETHAGPSELIEPQPQDLVPFMLRGCSHGDLHGRNVLVGLAHDRALWPTVFDYEDMGPSNLCGWDFVKLETELKIRAYRDFLSRNELQYMHAIREAEISLNEVTERHHQDLSWPLVSGDPLPVNRLRSALLEIRRMASLHLGTNRGRPNQWLEEYYFLLAAYGVNMATYGNLERRELVAAYVAAGVATSRLSWPQRREPAEKKWFRVE